MLRYPRPSPVPAARLSMPRPVSPSEPRAATGPIPVDSAQFPRIPGYRFQKRLGQGGMATVYLATQESLDRPVSIKVMEREALQDEVSKQRFENEARTIAKLTHPSIVNIYEVGRTVDGRMYYIMPLLANGDLSQRDMRGKEDRIIEVLRTLLSALDYAHARGVVHRDVKEENVLFDVADRPMLTDFGIALSKRDKSRITSAGHAVGSSGYMAPEQARGDIVDGRADLYSVGVVAFELLTGRLPFRSPDTLALALMHAQNPVPRLPPAKRHWQAFIDRAMAKSPDYRYRDAQHMIEALDKVDSRTSGRRFGRVLRGFDKTVDGRVWKHPGMIALFGVLLVLFGLYSARDRMPFLNGGEASAAPEASVPADAAPSTSPAPPPAAVATAPAKPAPVTVAPAKPRAVAPVVAPTASPTTSPAAVSQPAPAPPVAATVATAPAVAAATPGAASPVSAATSIAPDAAVFAEARDAIAHGNITSPTDDNAVDLARMAWKLSPNATDAQALAADTLKALAEQQGQAIVQHHDARVLDYQLKARPARRRDDRSNHSCLARIACARVAGDRPSACRTNPTASDAAGLKRTAALAKQLDLAGRLCDRHRGRAVAGKPTQRMQQRRLAQPIRGPGYVLLASASPKVPPAALARAEVTRHEYAQFVNATRRPASACGVSKTPDPAGTRKNWSEPGFSQTSEQPVVCVSWNDANAYAQWLSAQKGQHFRLATPADWHAATSAPTATGQAAVAGAYSEWMQNCACRLPEPSGRRSRRHGCGRTRHGAGLRRRRHSRGTRDGSPIADMPGMPIEPLARDQCPQRDSNRITLRALFVSGLLTLMPIWLTWVVFKFVFGVLSAMSSRPMGRPPAGRHRLAQRSPRMAWLADTWALTAIGMVSTILLILAVGMLARRVAGQRALGWFEIAIRRVPLAKTVYGSARQLLDLMSAPPDGGQRVVLIAFPHPGMKTVGFFTRTLRDDRTSAELAAVFVPTTPNPTGGYLLIVPVEELIATDWTVDQAMTFIISGGAVAPQHMPFSGRMTDRGIVAGLIRLRAIPIRLMRLLHPRMHLTFDLHDLRPAPGTARGPHHAFRLTFVFRISSTIRTSSTMPARTTLMHTLRSSSLAIAVTLLRRLMPRVRAGCRDDRIRHAVDQRSGVR